MPSESKQGFKFIDPAASKRRASKACWSCRKRKVRCDVLTGKAPCTQCRLEGFSCVIPQRKPKGTKARRPPTSAGKGLIAERNLLPESTKAYERHWAPVATELENSPNFNDCSESTVAEQFDCPWSMEVKSNNQHLGESHVLSDQYSNEPSQVRIPDASFEQIFDWFNKNQGIEKILPSKSSALKCAIDALYSMQLEQEDSQMLQSSHLPISNSSPSTLKTEVWSSFRTYSFLRINSHHHISETDASFLEQQGCFQVPSRALLVVFIKEYFLHVQPMLPTLNESEFWNIFDNPDGTDPDECPLRISLYVIQAMLSAAAIFTSLHILKRCGFVGHQDARHTFSRRAKLLYDFNAEENPVFLVQGALLLSLSCPNHDLAHGNSMWLTIAIHHARSSRINLSALERSPAKYLEKRLWWCCVLRDRFMSLMCRRPLQITLEMFDPSQAPEWSLADFESDFDGSLVYDRKTKTQLAEIFMSQLNFMTKLSELLTIAYPPNGAQVPHISCFSDYADVLARLVTCKREVTSWFEDFQSKARPWSCRTPWHKLLILFENRLTMSYHTATIALHHTEIMLSYCYPKYMNTLIEKRLYTARGGIYDSIMAICEITGELSFHSMVSKLPMEGPAYTVFPLLLLGIALNVTSEVDWSLSLHRRLDVLSESMDLYRTKWEGIDKVFDSLGKLIPIVQDYQYSQRGSPQSQQEAAGKSLSFDPMDTEQLPKMKSRWCDFLKRHPKLHLQIGLALNFCISKGRCIAQDDLPEQLRTMSEQMEEVEDLHEVEAAVEAGIGVSVDTSINGIEDLDPWEFPELVLASWDEILAPGDCSPEVEN